MDFYKILCGGIGVGMSNFDRLFAEKHGGGGIQEITGTLPFTVSSRASQILKNYIIYGTASGAGVETENLWDVSKIANNGTLLIRNGDTLYLHLSTSASVSDGKLSTLRDYVRDLTPGTYIFTAMSTGTNKYIYLSGVNAFLRFGQTITLNTQQEVDSYLDSVVYFYASGVNTSAQISNMLFIKSSTAPSSYIPHGYKLPLMVSEVTENLWNEDNKLTDYMLRNVPSSETDLLAYSSYFVTDYVRLKAGIYTLSVASQTATAAVVEYIRANIYSLSKNFIANVVSDILRGSNSQYQFEISEDCYFRSSMHDGTTATLYGALTSNYDLFIGDSQLMAEEYVDYEEQKIYKLIGGVLTPTDPPVPLPDISLPQDEVTIDIDEDMKPQATIEGRIEQIT